MTAELESLKAQLDHLLQRHGATARATGHDDEQGRAFVAFTMAGKQVRMLIPMPRATDWPDPSSYSWLRKAQYPENWNRWDVHQRCEWVAEQVAVATRQRWQMLLELVTVKFRAIDMGLTSVEREFPDIEMAERAGGDWRGREAVEPPQQLEAWQAPPPALGAHPGQSSAMVVKKW